VATELAPTAEDPAAARRVFVRTLNLLADDACTRSDLSCAFLMISLELVRVTFLNGSDLADVFERPVGLRILLLSGKFE
jgi:hypothetical protein